MANFEKLKGHVRLHRLWVFTILRGELSFPEHRHVLDCEECRIALAACGEADSFGAVLKMLNRGEDVDDNSKAG